MRTMSVIFLLFVGCSLLGLVSCGDDDAGIVGIWQLYSWDGETSGADEEMFFEFDVDGTLTITVKERGLTTSLPGTYSLSDDVITIIIEDNVFGDVVTGTWVRTGNTLTITSTDDGVLVLKKTDKT